MHGPAAADDYVFDCGTTRPATKNQDQDFEAFREANPQVLTLPMAPPGKSISAVIAIAVMLQEDVCLCVCVCNQCGVE